MTRTEGSGLVYEIPHGSWGIFSEHPRASHCAPQSCQVEYVAFRKGQEVSCPGIVKYVNNYTEDCRHYVLVPINVCQICGMDP
jgi:hypothetical protein